MHPHVAILKTSQGGSARAAARDRRMERTEIRTENVGCAHHLVKVRANNVIAAGPFAQTTIAPKNLIVAIEKDDAVGHALQHALVLNQSSSVDHFGKMVGVGVDADIVA